MPDTGAIHPNPYIYTGTTPVPAVRSGICFCVGGPNCCIKVAEREREARLRAEVRAEVLEECRRHLVTRHTSACAFFDPEMEMPEDMR